MNTVVQGTFMLGEVNLVAEDIGLPLLVVVVKDTELGGLCKALPSTTHHSLVQESNEQLWSLPPS